ncbi:MAG: DNA primase [Sumerlaeia bacterium]
MPPPTDFKEAIRQIKDQADILAIVGRTVALKKAGMNYKGLCPFHQEKTPSFTVYPDKNLYKCYGCNKSGSVLDFVMETERLDFMEALRQLSRETGIELPSDDASPEDRAARTEAQEKRHAIFSANEFALQWFRTNLVRGRNRVATETLERRGISREVAERFAIGATIDGWDPLTMALLREGYSAQLLQEAGLSGLSEKSGKLFDRFRERLIFPILDHRGRPIGFGGRRLNDADEKAPKYLNSAETEVYKKGQSLYALDVAQQAVSKAGYAILTEGYMDTIMAHQHGFPQAVASLGTALTPDQARLLKRYGTKLYFLYDGDAAGQKAMLKGGEAILGAGFDARVIVLPDGMDPDDFLKAQGAEALRERMNSAAEYFEFALDALSAEADPSTLAGQGRLASLAAPMIQAIRNDVLREGAISRLISRLGGMPREAVYHELGLSHGGKPQAKAWKEPPHRPTDPRGGADPNVIPPPEPRRDDGSTLDPLDRFTLKLMLESPEALDRFRGDLNEAWLRDERLRGWVMFFHDGEESVQDMIAEIEAGDCEAPGDLGLLHTVWAEEQPIPNAGHAAEQLLARLKRRHHMSISNQLIRELRKADESSVNGMLRLYQEENGLVIKTQPPRAPENSGG